MMDTSKENDNLLHHYEQSTCIQTLIKSYKEHKPLRLAFLDIDFTLSSNIDFLPKLRAKLQTLGYVIIFVTARTEEIVMSGEHYEKSKQYGFHRKPPLLKKKEGIYTYVDPKTINPYLVDPDIIIGTTGTQMLFKQQTGGFFPIVDFQKQFGVSSQMWRNTIMDIIADFDKKRIPFTLAPFESAENYYAGKSNVFPPDYRIQIEFDSLEEKIIFFKEMKKRNLLNTFFNRNPASAFRIIDDSDEREGKYVIYIVPKKAGKRHAVQYFVSSVISFLQSHVDSSIKIADIETILAGDGMPDLAMLLQGAVGTNSISLIVGGSIMGKALSDYSINTYAGENIQLIKDKLQPLQDDGYYLYPVQTHQSSKILYQKIIIGDDAFPTTKGPETILAFLEEEIE